MEFASSPVGQAILIVGGVALIPLIIQLVQILKEIIPPLKKGRRALGLALSLGLVLGGAAQYFAFEPKTAADWFMLVVLALSAGAAASKAYDEAKARGIKFISSSSGG